MCSEANKPLLTETNDFFNFSNFIYLPGNQMNDASKISIFLYYRRRYIWQTGTPRSQYYCTFRAWQIVYTVCVCVRACVCVCEWVCATNISSLSIWIRFFLIAHCSLNLLFVFIQLNLTIISFKRDFHLWLHAELGNTEEKYYKSCLTFQFSLRPLNLAKKVIS